MLLLLLFLFLMTAAVLMLGIPLLLWWALPRNEEVVSVPDRPRTILVNFQDGRIWSAFVKWTRSKPAQLVHRPAD